MLTKKLRDALDRNWHWEVGGEYGTWQVDQYDTNEGNHRIRHSSIDFSLTLKTRTMTERIAAFANLIYREGTRKGRAEILNALAQNRGYEDFSLDEFLEDYEQRMDI